MELLLSISWVVLYADLNALSECEGGKYSCAQLPTFPVIIGLW